MPMFRFIAVMFITGPLLFAPAALAGDDDGILRETVSGVFTELEREAINSYYDARYGDAAAPALGADPRQYRLAGGGHGAHQLRSVPMAGAQALEAAPAYYGADRHT